MFKDRTIARVTFIWMLFSCYSPDFEQNMLAMFTNNLNGKDTHI